MICHLPRFDARIGCVVERLPRRTVYPGRYLCFEDHFGAWTVAVITRDDGAVRTWEPLRMVPDRATAEAHIEQLIAHTDYARKAA